MVGTSTGRWGGTAPEMLLGPSQRPVDGLFSVTYVRALLTAEHKSTDTESVTAHLGRFCLNIGSRDDSGA
jgi:hypothetical protein